MSIKFLFKASDSVCLGSNPRSAATPKVLCIKAFGDFHARSQVLFWSYIDQILTNLLCQSCATQLAFKTKSMRSAIFCFALNSRCP